VNRVRRSDSGEAREAGAAVAVAAAAVAAAAVVAAVAAVAIALVAMAALVLPGLTPAAAGEGNDATAPKTGFVHPPRLWWQEVRAGNGRMSSRRHPLPSGGALVLRLPFPVEIRCGAAPDSAGITAFLDTNLQELVSIEEKEGRVEVDLSGPCRSDLAARMVIDLPELTALSAHGPGPVEALGVASDRLELVQIGAAELTVKGVVDRLDLTVYGSGDVLASDLAVRVGVFEILGAGGARVAVWDSLAAALYGAGDLDCLVEPNHVDSRRFGRGALHTP